MNKSYEIIKEFLLKHDVTSATDLPIDIVHNDSKICWVGDYIVEVKFNDTLHCITYFNIYAYDNDKLEAVLMEDKKYKKIIDNISKVAHNYNLLNQDFATLLFG